MQLLGCLQLWRILLGATSGLRLCMSLSLAALEDRISRLEAAVFLRLPAARSEGTTSDPSTTASSVLWDLGDLLFEADICAAHLQSCVPSANSS